MTQLGIQIIPTMPFVRPEMFQRYQIAGTPAECREAVQSLIATYALDALVMNVTTPGIEANRQLLRDIQAIVR